MNKSKRRFIKLITLNDENNKMEKLRKMFRKLKTLDDKLDRNKFETVALQFANEFTKEWNKDKNSIERVLNELTYESLAEINHKIEKINRLMFRKWNEKVKIELEEIFYYVESVEDKVMDELNVSEYIGMACMINEKVVECIYAEMIGYDGWNKAEFIALKREDLMEAKRKFNELVRMTYEEEFGNWMLKFF